LLALGMRDMITRSLERRCAWLVKEYVFCGARKG
jgi:hypothetical protein